MGEKRHTVLIADDYEADRFFMRQAILRHAPKMEVVGEVCDGEDAIAYLAGEGIYSDRAAHPIPDLLILDARMPRMTGIDVLEWLEAHPIPGMKVAMMADSSSELYRQKAMELGARHFYSKLINRDELVKLVKKIEADLEGGAEGKEP